MKIIAVLAVLLLPVSAVVAQEEFGRPIGEDAAPIDGPMVGGNAVGNPAVGGPMVGGEAVGDPAVGGPMVGGGAVGNAPVGGAMVGGAAVGQEEDDAAVGNQPLY